MSTELVEDVPDEGLQHESHKAVPYDLHRELLKLAQLVNLESFLSENSQVDDYVVVVEEASHRLGQLMEAPQSIEAAARAKAAHVSKQDQQILQKSKQFESELLGSLNQIDKRDEWYEKCRRLAAKLQKEKLQHGVLEEFAQAQNKKITVLVDHVDKLMKAIKIENTKRIKLVDDARRLQKEDDVLRAKLERQARVIATQQRAIREVSEGSKVLEDQLKLMDEKFLELRAKLDITRDHLNKQIKAVKRESFELRTKYAAATNGGSLDKVRRQDASWSMAPSGTEARPPSAGGAASPVFGRPAALDMDSAAAIRSRSRSVDFMPQALVATPSGAKAMQQVQLQSAFLGGLSLGLPPDQRPGFLVGAGVGAGTGVPGTPAHRTAGSPTTTNNDRSRPASASNEPEAAAARAAPPRPKTAALHAQSRSSLSLSASKASNDRALRDVVRKIDRKSGHSTWTADRLVDLLG